ncbi:MAG TPA: lipid A deacylase LpxR family protein [Kiloniellales bacterium]|nr:lipid A deacylase LpxR family protein [Kiloniellales bacterium]
MRAILAAALLSLSLPAFAEEAVPQPIAPPAESKPAPLDFSHKPGDRVTVTLENDRFAGDTDRNYTNGLKFAWMGEAGPVPQWMQTVVGLLPLVETGQSLRWMVEVGQSIFTPETLSTETPPSGERPYVGWLYAGASALVEDEHTLDRIGLLLGVLGPGAGAGSTQGDVHGLFGMEDPQGWDSQPDTRPGIVFMLDRVWRYLATQPNQLVGLEILPHAGMALGNVYTQGAAGVLLRIGSDLMSQPLPSAVMPGLPPGPARESSDGDFAWSLFLDLTGRAVGHNVTVEGLDGEGPDARPLVGEATAGLTLSWAGISVTYAQTLRTAEAEGQDEADNFGGFTIGLDF